jgi:hypothetical protein
MSREMNSGANRALNRRRSPRGRSLAVFASTALCVMTLSWPVSAAPPSAEVARSRMAITPLLSPGSSNAVTSNAGDNNGFQTGVNLAFADGGGGAVDTNSGNTNATDCLSTGKDKHNFTYFVTVGVTGTLPTTATISGVEIRMDANADATAGAPRLCARVSADSGATWSTVVLSTTTLSTSEATYTLGGPGQLWGRTWTPNDFTSGKFRIQVIPVSSNTARDFTLDWVATRIHFN